AHEPAPKELALHDGLGWWSQPGDVDCFLLPLSVPPAGAVVRLELSPPAGVTARLQVTSGKKTLADVRSLAPGQPAIVPALGARSWEASYVACTSAAAGS